MQVKGTQLILPAGSALVTPALFTAGVNLTNAQAGAEEFDGIQFYNTVNTVNGRAQAANFQVFRLAANGSAIGPTIADYFGTNSSIPTVLNGVYRIRFYLHYLKTTAGTVTYTITSTQTFTNLVAKYTQMPVGGIGTNASPTMAGISGQTAAASALPVTGSLTTGVNHYCEIEAIAEMATAGNVRLKVTQSLGTLTPLRGSYYTVERLAAGNVGTFAA